MLITFEGGEGAGKTTLIASLVKELEKRGKKVVITREPGSTELGEMIRTRVLLSKGKISPMAELLLFLAARAEHLKQVIEPALHDGIIVLCDRFNDSSIAYQGEARGLGFDTVRSLCLLATGQITPHLTFLLDLDPEKGMKRLVRGKDRIESEGMSFHQNVRKAFLKIARQEPERVVILDASQEPDVVLQEAIKHVDRKL